MPQLGHRLSIRLQLLGLFGLLLLAGASVLGIDEWERRSNQRALAELQEESLATLRRIKAVSDAYGLDLKDTTFRVRNYLISWEEGVIVVDNARMRIRAHWAALADAPRSPEQEALFQQIDQARARADAAAEQLRAVLARKDIAALGRFADTELFPALDPVTVRLKHLSDLEMIEAEARVRAADERSRWISWLRWAISFLALVVAAFYGQRLVRNIYKGVESLTLLAQQMARHDYKAAPRYRPDGELGLVVDSFLQMRDDVQTFEAKLNAELLRNEQVRATLQEREVFQRSLFAAARVAVMSLDLEGKFTSFNPFAERLTGYRAEEMIGKRSLDGLLLPEEATRVARDLTAALDRQVTPDARLFPALIEQGSAPLEWTLRRKDGSTVPALIATSAMRDERGKTVGYLGVGTDLTQIKILEQKLRASEIAAREANEAKSSFLAAMSHEIRTPMIGVTGMLEVLSHTSLDADQRRTMQVIQQSAASLLQIIGDILDFSKVEAGKLEIAPTTISLARLLQSTVANYSDSASSKGLTLTAVVDERLGPAYVADGLRLRQILSNFLSNAIKFTDKGMIEAVLEFRGRELDDDRDRVSFRVTDTGIGVTPEQMARLFQPFSQAEGNTTRRFGGTGLGLVIARRLAELMGGEVVMESSPGMGTTMRLNLSLAHGNVDDLEPDAGAPGARQKFVPRALPSLEEAERERSLILLVDDHPTNRLVVARQLGLAGYACEAVENGLLGLERWRSGRYALVLSDVHMPVMDGYEMTGELRKEEARRGLARTPVVALTAAALKGEAERALAAGMDDYLIKPVSIPELSACLHKWLPHTQARPGAATAAAAAPSRAAVADDPSDAALLDRRTLDELTGGDPRETRALLDDFLASTQADISSVHLARAANDLARLASEAHKIKGAARLVGALALADAAAAVETAAKAGDWTDVLPLLAAVDDAAARLRQHVARQYPG